jgi:hypothetical protein
VAQGWESATPTPWATGLPIAAFIAVLVGIGDVAFVRAIAVAAGWLWVPANIAVCAGLAPGVWLLRHVPFWRWFAYGTAAGLLAAWVVLIVRGTA